MARTTKLLVASILSFGMLAGVPAMAAAQGPGSGNVSLDLDSVDVREAIRALFKSVGLNYSIAPEVQGTVTVNVKNVPFETALQNILRQVEATYRLTGGVYEIVKRDIVVLPPTPSTGDQPKQANQHRRIFVRSMDPMLFAALAGKEGGQQNYNLAPELSTVLNSPRNGSGNGGFGNSGPGGSFGNGSGNFSGPGTGGRNGGPGGGGGPRG